MANDSGEVIVRTQPPKRSTPFYRRWQRKAVRLLVEGFFHGTSGVAKLLPISQPRRHGVEVLRDLPYQDTGLREHLLDIYRPLDRKAPLPVIFYVHGGGFSLLSKETHWVFGLGFARRGYLVVNINYRLAPRHPFPAGAMDVCAAYRWVHEHIAEYGGDPTRIAVAGESAGANFATGLAIASCTPRPEPWARAVYELNRPPHAVLAACGLFQVSDIERYVREKRVGSFIGSRLADLASAYLGELLEGEPHHFALADPLLILEQGLEWERPLPPFFVPVGTADPILHDTQRLEAALKQAGVTHVAKYYPHQTHAFHAFLMLKSAVLCWRDMYEFLDRHFPAKQSLDDDAPMIA